jgi:hypothetical protein
MGNYSPIKSDWPFLLPYIELILAALLTLPALHKTIPIGPLGLNPGDNILGDGNRNGQQIPIILANNSFALHPFEYFPIKRRFRLDSAFRVLTLIPKLYEHNMIDSAEDNQATDKVRLLGWENIRIVEWGALILADPLFSVCFLYYGLGLHCSLEEGENYFVLFGLVFLFHVCLLALVVIQLCQLSDSSFEKLFVVF